jgi:dTDP-4-dehydrorhamnose reductase
MKNCLLLGSRGMLGSCLMQYIPSTPAASQWRLSGYDLPDVDIADAASVEKLFFREKPSVVVNCAAYTNVDGAEDHRDAAFRVNAAAPEILARAAAAMGSALVHLSTDFIFDGNHPGPYREDDAPNPLSVYARSKLLGEKAVAAIAPEHLIIRTAWLYGPNGKNFVDTILQIARDKGALKVVDDQAGSPTFTYFLAEYLWKLVTREARGIYHVAGAGVCTWYDLACEAVRLAGVTATVTPCTTAQFPRPATRPRNSSLDVGKAERLLGEDLPNWRNGLRRYLTRQY